MAKKEYKLEVLKQAARKRSGRAVSENVTVSGGGSPSTEASVPSGAGATGTGDGHTHANKGVLDRIGLDEEGYVTVSDMVDSGTGDGVTQEAARAKVGFADEARTLTEDSEVWEMFVKRLEDDVVKGNITFEKAIAVAGLAALAGGLRIGTDYSITAAGKAVLGDITAKLIEATGLGRGDIQEWEQLENGY